MTDLTPAAADSFFRRFHHGHGGRLLRWTAELGPVGVGRLRLELRLRDRRADDRPTDVTLELIDVAELRWQVRPTETPAALDHGIHIGHFQDRFFLDLHPWDEKFEGPHDFRVSSCYAAAARLRAAISGEDA